MRVTSRAGIGSTANDRLSPGAWEWDGVTWVGTAHETLGDIDPGVTASDAVTYGAETTEELAKGTAETSSGCGSKPNCKPKH